MKFRAVEEGAMLGALVVDKQPADPESVSLYDQDMINMSYA